MTDHEKKIIDQSIQACENIIKHYKKQIEVLLAKKTEFCCFEHKIKNRLKIKRTKCQKNKKTY